MAVNGDFSLPEFNKYKAEFVPSDLIDNTITFSNIEVSTLSKKIERASNYRISQSSIGNGIDVLQDFLSKKHIEKLSRGNLKEGQGVLVLSESEIKLLDLNNDEIKWLKPYYGTKLINKYTADDNNDGYFILYANKEFRENIKKYPNIKRYLDSFAPILTSAFAPYGLHRAREEKFFSQAAIYGLRKTPFTAFSFVDFPSYVTRAFMILQPDDYNLKALTGVLNSSVSNFWFKNNGKLQGSQLQIDKDPLMKFPLIKPTDDIILKLSILVENIQNIRLSINQIINKFNSYLSKILYSELSSKLQNWHKLDFEDFISELNKITKNRNGNKLSKSDEMDWMDIYEIKKTDIKTLKSESNKYEKEIDQIIYKLYDLNEDEIIIVESN